MSCAAVAMPPSALHAPIFKGDADYLVDHLIAACAKKPSPQGYTGFGRELVPCEATGFFEDLVTPTCLSAAMSKALEKRSSSKSFTQAQTASHKHPRASTQSPPAHKSIRTSDKASPEPVPQAGRRARAVARDLNNGFAAASAAINIASAASAPPTAGYSAPPKAAAAAARMGYVCPAFATSPKPEAVPMPTSGLLVRAANAAAKSRSPSPPAAAAERYDRAARTQPGFQLQLAAAFA